MYFKRLESLRIDNDKTQMEIANYLCCERNTYRKYEKGDRDIPVKVLIQLCAFYHVSADYILEIDEGGIRNEQP